MSRTLEQFDVEERPMSSMETGCPNVKVMHKMMKSLDTDKHVRNVACFLFYNTERNIKICVWVGDTAE